MPASISGIALAIGLLITWWLWHNETQNITAMFQTKFDSRVNEFERLTTNRIHDYEQVLLGMRGLFAASKEVGRGEFHDYADALNMAKNFPGANGLCFSLIVPAVKKDRHIAAIRNSGFSSYSIRPNTPRDFYTSIIFAEPFSGRNQRALGFDNFTDATRRIAMELSRDSGNMSISGKVILLHEADAEQAGIRMYLPIYKKGASALTLEDRRTNIIGWLYMPIRMDDFMRDALGLRAGRLDVEIYDGDIVTPDSLMFDSDVTRSHLAEDSNSLFKTVKTISVRGHNWTLAAHSLPSFDARLSEGKQEFIIYAGTGISFLLAFLTWLFLYGRSRILVEAQSVARSEAQLSSIIENALDAVIQLDIQGRVCGWNSRAEQMFGWRRDAAHGQVFEEMAISVASRYKFRSHMEEPQAINPKYQAQFKEAKSNERSKLIALHRDGSEFPIELSMTQNILNDGNYQYTAFIRDITVQIERETAQQLATNILDTVEEAVMVTDTDHNIIRVNPAFTSITGYDANDVIGHKVSIFSSAVNPTEIYADMREVINKNGLWKGELRDRRKSGEDYVKWMSVKLMQNENLSPSHYLWVFSDISERKAAEEQLKQLAHYDLLTSLPNRALFDDRLKQSITMAKRENELLALMFIDLDRFKPVNDNYGHAVGDQLLKEVALRLLDCVRESDTVSRIGGDEFVILLPTIVGQQDAVLVAEKVLQSLSEPFDLSDLSLSISCSIGIAIFPGHGDNKILLTKHADIAMYHAKHGGRNNALVYQTGMQEGV